MDKSKFAVETYEKIADIYTQQYFNDLRDTPYIDKFLTLLPKGAKVLDVGCGPGNFAQYIHEKGFDIEGVDLSQEMLKIAKSKVPGVVFNLMDMRTLEYPECTFDGLLVAYSLIHIPSEEIHKTLIGFNTVLNPNGLLMIIAQGGEADKIVDEPLLKGEQIFINFFTKERLIVFLTDAGFKIEYQEEIATQDSESLSKAVIYTIARKC